MPCHREANGSGLHSVMVGNYRAFLNTFLQLIKHLLALLFLFAATAMAAPNTFETKSPNGKVIVRFEQQNECEDYLVSILTSDGRDLFSYKGGLTISKDSMIWNDSGTILAYSSGTSFLMECFLLNVDQDKWSILKTPAPKEGWDNFHQTPASWKKDMLSLKVDGPYAGKADGHYSGSMKIQVLISEPIISVLSENIKTIKNDAAANH